MYKITAKILDKDDNVIAHTSIGSSSISSGIKRLDFFINKGVKDDRTVVLSIRQQ